MMFLKNISIKNFLIGIVGILALSMAGISFNNVLNAYRSGKEIRRIGIANKLSDLVISASGYEGRERGYTTDAIASSAAVDGENLRKMEESRAKGDAALKEAYRLAHELAGVDGDNKFLSSSLSRAERLYSEMETVRKSIDSDIGKESRRYSPQEWIKLITSFIDANAELRVAANTSSASKETLQEALRMNLELKQALWLVSEYAGRERATAANFVGARKPIDAASLEKLNTFRAIVDLNIKPILRLKDMPGIDPAVQSSVDKMQDVFLDKFGSARNAIYAAGSTGDYPLSGKEWLEKSTEAIDAILGVSGSVGRMVSDKVAVDMSAAKRDMTLSIIFLASILSVGVISLVGIRKKVIAPVHYIRDTMAEIEKTGNLDVRIDVKNQDEIGEMAGSFNKMIEKFHDILKDIRQSTNHLASSSEELSAAAVQIAGGSKSQSAKATQVSAAAKQMNATILEVARNVSSASDAAKDASGVATRGGGIVTRTIDSMNGISTSAKESSARISALGDRSKDIGNIINVIDDIADQTNLLALNAAIEAARAGEQGRGFAVVADEVRKLAEKTMQATKEIGSMIKSMQDETARAITSVEREVVAVEDGVNLATEAGKSLKEIVSKVGVVTSMIHQVATTSEEQSAATEQISGDIESVAGVVSETSSSAEQIAGTSRDIAELAVSLKCMVDIFKISGISGADEERPAVTQGDSKVVPFRRAVF